EFHDIWTSDGIDCFVFSSAPSADPDCRLHVAKAPAMVWRAINVSAFYGVLATAYLEQRPDRCESVSCWFIEYRAHEDLTCGAKRGRASHYSGRCMTTSEQSQ